MEEEVVLDQEVAQDAIHSEDVKKDKKAKKKEKATRKQPKNQEKKVEETKASDLENVESLQEREASLSEDKENKKEIDLYSEKKEIIKVEHLTKDYGNGRGIFDISFTINKGEVFGFVGTNGSGKTTTIRHIMGFLKAREGSVEVLGLDAWKDSSEIKKYVSYIPGEIAFPDLNTGTLFLKSQAELLKLKDMTYANELISRLQLDTSANLKRMSKGMKQKTAIVAALMANKDILILDEPTTGLDPLMREVFLDIILEEKQKGKTILMSSQMFDELEITCDRVALILNGKIIDIADIEKLKNPTYRMYKIEFKSPDDYQKFKKLKYEFIRFQDKYNQVTIKIEEKRLNKLFNDLKNYNLKFISEVKNNLERHFRQVLAIQGDDYVYKEEVTRKDRKRAKKQIKREKKEKRREEDVQ